MNKVVAVIPTNELEELKVVQKEYKGKKYFDIRQWFLKDGLPFPTRRGLTISEAIFNQLREKLLDMGPCEHPDQKNNICLSCGSEV